MSLLQVRKRFTAFHWAVIGLTATMLLGLWIATYVRLETDRRETIAQTEVENSNLAIALEAHTLRTLKGLDQLLFVLAHEIEQEGIEANVLSILNDAVDPNVLASAYVIDASGKIVKGTGPFKGVDLSDREHFRAHADGGATGMVIGRPVLGRMTGKRVIPISRAFRKRDGSFGGIVGMGIDPAYFTAIYSQMRIGDHGYAQIMRSDGFVLVRRVGLEVKMDVDLRNSNLARVAGQAPAGSFQSTGRVDGIKRFVSYRALAEYPLVVSVGQDVEEALSPFEEHRRDYLVAAGFFSVLLLVFGGVLGVMARRESRGAAELARSEALHRATFDRAPLGITYTRADGKFIDANRAYCQMVGYSREELLGMTYMDLMSPEQIERLPVLRGELERTSRLSVEAGSMRKKGGAFRVSMEAALLRDDQGRPELIVAIVQDITERERARTAMEEQLDELRRFRRVAVDRELRMIAIEEENRRLREKAEA